MHMFSGDWSIILGCVAGVGAIGALVVWLNITTKMANWRFHIWDGLDEAEMATLQEMEQDPLPTDTELRADYGLSEDEIAALKAARSDYVAALERLYGQNPVRQYWRFPQEAIEGHAHMTWNSFLPSLSRAWEGYTALREKLLGGGMVDEDLVFI